MILTQRAARHGNRCAIVAPEGAFDYRQLEDASNRVASFLLDGSADLKERPVAFMAPPGFDYVALQWGIWKAGGIAVPLSLFHPRPELEYVIEDTMPVAMLAHPYFTDLVKMIADDRKLKFASSLQALEHEPAGPLPEIVPGRGAMIIYTSGTTGKPKGVVITHENMAAQIESMVEAWGWTPEDRILEVLPLHHVHGVTNVISTAMWVGAVCEIFQEFNARKVWDRIVQGGLTLFMAVPTIYMKLIDAWEKSPPSERETMSAAARRLRLMVSGSAALPVTTLERWKEITGHVLLERYGMTEIGMALSNPLNGERVPGAVGTPLPGVEVRLVDEKGVPVEPPNPGEIEIRGKTVFREYWRKPDETAKTFRNGWFRSGDIAVVENGVYRILGRSSVDIIKTGGFKVSGLEVEQTLLTHPDIKECAVVGSMDPVWGERVCAAVVLKPGAELTRDQLRAWAKERLATYKVPKDLMIFEKLPRSAMGKVLKPELKEIFKGE